MKDIRKMLVRTIATIGLAGLTAAMPVATSFGDGGNAGAQPMENQGVTYTPEGGVTGAGAGAGGSTDTGTTYRSNCDCSKETPSATGQGTCAGGATTPAPSGIKGSGAAGGMETGPAAADPGYSR